MEGWQGRHPSRLMKIGPAEQEIIIKIAEAIIMASLGYIARVFFKVVQNVSAIPKMREDLNVLYGRIRELEKNGRDTQKSP